MADIKLASGFVFDVTNLYGPGKVTEEEVAAFAPVYQKAHDTITAMRSTGTIAGH